MVLVASFIQKSHLPQGAEINIRTVAKFRTIPEETAFRDPNYLFSITADKEKNGNETGLSSHPPNHFC